MKIAQISLLHDAIVSSSSSNAVRTMLYLIAELRATGHEVAVFAADPGETVAGGAHQFDVVHLHCDRLQYPLIWQGHTPCIATLHAPCDGADKHPASNIVLAPTSVRQLVRTEASGCLPIPPGLPHDLYQFREAAEGYVAFTGRLERESGIKSAVLAAARRDLTLKVISDVLPQDRSYFLDAFRPLLRSNHRVQWVSELDERSRSRQLAGAVALLACCDRSGAFELNVAEALACGTPVIAWSNTTASDIVQDGVTGFVVETVEDAANALARISELDRRACRQAFERRFDVRVVASQYRDLYRRANRAYQAAMVTVGSCLESQGSRRVQAQVHPPHCLPERGNR